MHHVLIIRVARGVTQIYSQLRNLSFKRLGKIWIPQIDLAISH